MVLRNGKLGKSLSGDPGLYGPVAGEKDKVHSSVAMKVAVAI
jgi:hypothetical protein